VYFVLIWLVGSQQAIDFHYTKIKTL